MTKKKLAGCVIVNENGEVLLLHRNITKLTQWELPGGKQEPGESLAETAKRETLEELDVEVAIIRELGIGEFEHAGVNWVYTWFLAKITSGTPRPAEADRYDGVKYFNLLDKSIEENEISINIINLIKALKNKSVNL